jgi:hypothetical protein
MTLEQVYKVTREFRGQSIVFLVYAQTALESGDKAEFLEWASVPELHDPWDFQIPLGCY